MAEVANPAEDEVELGRVELAPLEGAEAVEGLGLGELALGAMLLMEQQALACDAGGVAGDGLGRDGELAGDLAEGGATQEPVEDREQELGLLEPVAGAEGLLGEVTPAVTALEPLDALGRGVTAEEAGTDPAPASGWAGVEWARGIGAERGRLGGDRGGHVRGSLQAPRPLQSPEHK